jgi:hypothetical protein
MLAELYEYRAVLLEGAEGSLCTAEVAGLEEVIVVLFFVEL